MLQKAAVTHVVALPLLWIWCWQESGVSVPAQPTSHACLFSWLQSLCPEHRTVIKPTGYSEIGLLEIKWWPVAGLGVFCCKENSVQKILLCQVFWVADVSLRLSRLTGKRWISFCKPLIRSLQPSAMGKKGLSRSVLLCLISWLPLKLNLHQFREKSWASAVTLTPWLSSWHMWSW